MAATILFGAALIAMAETIARRAHEGQYRRGEPGAEPVPYFVHPADVANRVDATHPEVSAFLKTVETYREIPSEHVTALLKSTAYLHDVLEDTSTTKQDLLNAGIPEEVVTAVETMTKTAGVPYEEYIIRVKANPLARIVKIADMKSNLADTPSAKQITKYAKGLDILALDRTD